MRVSLFVLQAVAGLATAKSAVLDLIPSNFDDVVLKSGKPTLVEFFAPWCGHCKNLAPVYEDLAQAYSFSDKVQIAKVDADAEKSLGKRFGVQGFPTLKYFDGKSAEPIDYNSGRDLESLSSFLTEKTGVRPRKAAEVPSSVVMLTDTTFKETIGGDKDVLVAFTAPWCGHCKNLAPIYEKVATDFAAEEGVVVAKVDAEAENSKQTAEDQGVRSYPTIKFFAKGSKEAQSYGKGRDEQSFVDFLNEKAGTHRTVGGGLDDKAGTIAALDEIVARFVKAGPAKLSEAAAEAKKAANVLQADAQNAFAEYYVRVFNKLQENEGYAVKEFNRLKGILARGGLLQSKADQLTSKKNILKQFVEPAEKVVDEEKEDSSKDEL